MADLSPQELAKKYGATVEADPHALAAKYGATVAPVNVQGGERPGIVSSAIDTAGGLVKGAATLGWHTLQSLFGDDEALRKDAQDAVDGQAAQWKKAQESIQRANQQPAGPMRDRMRTEALGHFGAALLPMVGPAAAHAGERIGGEAEYDDQGHVTGMKTEPDVRGGIGEGLVIAGAPLAGEAVKPIARAAGVTAKGAQAVTGKAVELAKTDAVRDAALDIGKEAIKEIPGVKTIIKTAKTAGRGREILDAALAEIEARKAAANPPAPAPPAQAAPLPSGFINAAPTSTLSPEALRAPLKAGTPEGRAIVDIRNQTRAQLERLAKDQEAARLARESAETPPAVEPAGSPATPPGTPPEPQIGTETMTRPQMDAAGLSQQQMAGMNSQQIAEALHKTLNESRVSGDKLDAPQPTVAEIENPPAQAPNPFEVRGRAKKVNALATELHDAGQGFSVLSKLKAPELKATVQAAAKLIGQNEFSDASISELMSRLQELARDERKPVSPASVAASSPDPGKSGVEQPPAVAAAPDRLPLNAQGRAGLDFDGPMATAMRKVDADAQRLIDYSEKLRPPSGTVGVGMDGVHEGFTGWSIRTLLREVGRGKPVAEAAKIATDELVGANKLQNSRNRDYTTQRWERNGVDKIEYAAKQLERAMGEHFQAGESSTAPETAPKEAPPSVPNKKIRKAATAGKGK